MTRHVHCSTCSQHIMDVDTEKLTLPMHTGAFSIPHGAVGFGAWSLIDGPISLDFPCPGCGGFPFFYSTDSGEILPMLTLEDGVANVADLIEEARNEGMQGQDEAGRVDGSGAKKTARNQAGRGRR